MDETNRVTLGVVQFACSDDVTENIATASRLPLTIMSSAGSTPPITLLPLLIAATFHPDVWESRCTTTTRAGSSVPS